ncbi:hypothetical protein [Archangium violaceum]|uniref:hypothetical protein n=1 Tax=Archangium violaceum TaxID=83451 RepID=UPI0036DC7847
MRKEDGAYYNAAKVGFFAPFKGPGTPYVSRCWAKIRLTDTARISRKGSDLEIVEFRLVEVAK